MALRATSFRKTFNFNFEARTSRGVMEDKTSWFIRLEDDDTPGTAGLGECGPLPGLSVDHTPEFEHLLLSVLAVINRSSLPRGSYAKALHHVPPELSSVVFGLETALLDLQNGGNRVVFKNDFVRGAPISINGLVWMGDPDFMIDQIVRKVARGFRCIKLKVGGLDFNTECDILRFIRTRYSKEQITIRLDANGAFNQDDVLYKLEELSQFDVHSIEQPVKPGLEKMEEVCRKSPIPVALDEELIGVSAQDKKLRLIDRLRPQFLVLKPTLHGGVGGCSQWIEIAQSAGIGWWITSALESNIGLNAICQFTAEHRPRIPQGLGTGEIYVNNVSSPLRLRDGNIFYDVKGSWHLDDLM